MDNETEWSAYGSDKVVVVMIMTSPTITTATTTVVMKTLGKYASRGLSSGRLLDSGNFRSHPQEKSINSSLVAAGLDQ
ncbi:hypothetical protein RRG08_033648 [Elysia crispata]|uniref:Uncharacterized protein n=1 Tax=Elysia crispata TaxID=231223 RepID=A0AAE1B7E5_9GAST|nr:hypothetical protein RRG08_033648 [Elysia crispata]